MYLNYDPACGDAPNTFNVRPVGTLFRIEAFIQTTSAAETRRAVFFVQQNEAGVVRRRTPEGAHALLIARVDEDRWRVEMAVLHADLPAMALMLMGWHQ